MRSFCLGAALGLAVGLIVTARADEVADAAEQTGVPEILLRGALAAQPGVELHQYLQFDGLEARPFQWPTGRLACIARVESRNDPNATNPRSGAAGLFQFLRGTWLSTPQGKAGLSPYDPQAATDAAQWMVKVGRINEWVAVSGGYC